MQMSSRITFMAWSEPSVLAFEHDENGKVIHAIEMLSLYLGECIVPAIGSGYLTLPALQQDVPVPVTFIHLNQKVPVPFSSVKAIFTIKTGGFFRRTFRPADRYSTFMIRSDFHRSKPRKEISISPICAARRLIQSPTARNQSSMIMTANWSHRRP